MIGCWNSGTNYKKGVIQKGLGYYIIVRIFLFNIITRVHAFWNSYW